MAKPNIVIERPDGSIPGLVDANAWLAENHGVVVAAVIDLDDKSKLGKWKWIGTQIREAHIDGDEIKVGKVLFPRSAVHG